jgi:antitoxin (DNA-binding transcriptional repressor) of toxin-antitoxin stability system
MKVIADEQLQRDVDAVMAAVEAGEVHRITRRGVEFAELRPLSTRHQPSTEELLAQARLLPQNNAAAMRREADE